MPGGLQPWEAVPTFHGFKGGDLYGIADHLDELQDLGITALSLNPVFTSASNHRYHTYDYLSVDPLLGGDDGLRVLIDACHARGMRIIVDGVFNHVGRGFLPFHHVLENGPESPYRDWFYLAPDVQAGHRPLHAYPHSGDGGERVDLGYAAWWGLAALPKLNTGNAHVREMLWQVGEHWLRFGADGWRIDVGEEIDDTSFWSEFRRRCRAINPEAYIVGEIWHAADHWLQGDRYDAVMNYPLAKAILGYTAGHRIARQHIEGSPEYGHVGPLDGPAFGREVMHLMTSYDTAVVAAQFNLIGGHDTARFKTMAGGDENSIRLATLLQATLPGAPCVYYGDEFGLEGGNDPGCRGAYPVQPTDSMRRLRTFVRELLRLRGSEAALRRGDLEMLAAADGGVAFARHLDGTTVLVAMNAGDHEVTLDLELGGVERFMSLPGWEDAVAAEARPDGTARLRIRRRSGAVAVLGVRGD